MVKLENYLYDGANYQARAVLMFLQRTSHIEESWNDINKRYDAEIEVGRWENCREQGYVVSIINVNHDQLNIAFFEHRNSDSICAIKWKQNSINTLNIDNAIFGDIYKDKYDVSFSVNYGEIVKMSDWIYNELEQFYIESMPQK